MHRCHVFEISPYACTAPQYDFSSSTLLCVDVELGLAQDRGAHSTTGFVSDSRESIDGGRGIYLWKYESGDL